MLQKRLAWALFVLLLSTLVCCQPTELIWAFFCFINFPILPPPPSLRVTSQRTNSQVVPSGQQQQGSTSEGGCIQVGCVFGALHGLSKASTFIWIFVIFFLFFFENTVVVRTWYERSSLFKYVNLHRYLIGRSFPVLILELNCKTLLHYSAKGPVPLEEGQVSRFRIFWTGLLAFVIPY